MSPAAPKRLCTYPGCGALVTGGRCARHVAQVRREVDDRRGSAASRGYGWRWQRATARTINGKPNPGGFLYLNPLCVRCLAAGRTEPSTVTDHIVPHKGDSALFWDPNNWQALCKTCHDRKTATEDGRWGA